MFDEEKDIEEQLFNEALASKRHKELIDSLNRIALLLSDTEDKAVIDAMKKQAESINKVSVAIQNQKPVQINNDKIIPLLTDIIEGNNDILVNLQNKPLVDEFKIQSTDEWSKTVKVIYKKASEII